MALSKIDVANMLTGLVPNDNTIRRPNATPLIINGDMQVAQRSVSETGKTSADYYTCDRMHSNIDSIGTYTIIQESLSSGNAYINGFTKAWRIDTTTADASPASGDNFSFIDDTEVPFGLPIRSYTSFKEAADEAAISRMYGGIHYRTAVELGVSQGRKVGELVLNKLTMLHKK